MRLVAVALLSALVVASPAGASTGQWGIDVLPTLTARNDPIVAPGQSTFGHLHVFQGNEAITPGSTSSQLLGSATNASDQDNHSAYWTPTLRRTSDGELATVHKMHVYYRKGTPASVVVAPLPVGLKIIAGDSRATKYQPASIVAWRCAEVGAAETMKPPAYCPAGVNLTATVRFPSCWDGVRLDSPDHKSHMAYRDRVSKMCPADHPVRVPQIQQVITWDVPGVHGYALTSDDLDQNGTVDVPAGATMHGDDWIVWEPAEMQRLCDLCLNGAGHDCGNVT